MIYIFYLGMYLGIYQVGRCDINSILIIYWHMIHAVYYCVLDSIMQIGIYRYYITLVIIGLMADSSGQYIMYPYRGDIKQFIQVEIRII